MIVLKPQAEQDLAEASAWYERKLAGLGLDFLTEIEKAFDRIDGNPLGYSKFHGELRRLVVRRFPYSVFYLTEDQRLVTIYGVLHQRRSPAIWQQRYTS